MFTKEVEIFGEIAGKEVLVECSHCGASGLYRNNKRVGGSDGGFIFLKNKIIRCKNHNFVLVFEGN